MESKNQCVYEFGPFVLDSVQHLLLRDHRPLALTPKTYDTLLELVKNSGRLLSKAELMQALWPDSFVEESNLTVQISAVRKILGDQQSYIVTVPGRGYRFSAEVKERPQTNAPAIATSAAHPASIREITETGDAEARNRDWATSGTLALHEVPKPEAVPVRSRRNLYYTAFLCGATLIAILLFAKLRPALPPPRVLGYTQLTDSGRVDPTSDILTDGTRVYFVGHPAGSKAQRLYQASVAEKETAEIPIPFPDFFLCDISPDHSQLLVGSSPESRDHPLWILSVLGGSPRRLGDISGWDAEWIPDGRGFIYSHGTDVFLAGPDGSGSRRLLSTPGFASGFRWSPDRKVIRFTVTNQATSLDSIWEASSDGSHSHPLLPGWNSPSTETGRGEWTADGRYFVFEAISEGKWEIWAIREKKDFLHKIPNGPVPVNTGPARLHRPRLSVDGRRLFAISLQNQGVLLRFDSGSSQFVSFLVGLSAHRLSFTNDGQWMTYVTYPEGELWRSRADGTDKLRLTFSPIHADLPRWSPDGTQIVFVDKPGGRPGDMFLVPVSGGVPKRLLPSGMSGSNPDWSPDGKLIAFGPQPTFASAPNAAGGTTAPGAMIHMLDVNTGKISDLPGSTGLYWPRWSTDGRYIAALSVDTHRLMLFDNRTQKWTRLASGATLHNPLWCRDGKTLYFQDLGVPGQPVYRLNIESHVQKRIGGPGPLSRPDSVYSALTGLTPDDSPIILEIHSIDDIYALDILLP